MQFQTLTYLFFVAIVFILFRAIPLRHRKILLLAASMVFYCWFRWEFGLLLWFVILVSFYSTRAARNGPALTAVSIVLVAAVLAFFKYFNFTADVANALYGMAGGAGKFDVWNVIVPVGISFFTFQAISYVVDCARDPARKVGSLVDYALYISFWPQLVAGPIMRSHEMVPQFNTMRRFSPDDFKEGCRRIIQGLFLKLVLADGLISRFVDEGFLNYAGNTMLDNWALAFAFGLQIYFDFDGYCSIAVGSALLFGCRLVENFDFPYAAGNPREFWKRWHISLSSWIRDYLYLPLTRTMVKRSRSSGGIETVEGRNGGATALIRSKALFLSWAIMGFWHGADWTFLLWGLWHAAVIQLYRFYLRLFPAVEWGERPNRFLGRLTIIPTVALIMPGWIFFRADSVTQAFAMLAGLFSFSTLPRLGYLETYYLQVFLLTAGFYLVWFLKEAKVRLPRFHWLADAALHAALALCVIAFFDREQPFIYFQF
ncbi:MAG: MBOAT family O-acyltransferase [bacterium]